MVSYFASCENAGATAGLVGSLVTFPKRSTCLGRVVGRGGRERRVEEGSASECVPIV